MATASTPGCWPFWRHGFLARWGDKLAKGADYTCVPGYDDLAQEVAAVHPEYSGDDGTERLFDILFSPYNRMPSAEELYRQALELAESCREPASLDSRSDGEGNPTKR